MNDLSKFLQSELTSFPAELGQSGGYIKFTNSGKRGTAKSFHISLEALYETLQNISDNLSIFSSHQKYVEKEWRDLGAKYFTNDVANATITVQRQSLYSQLSVSLLNGAIRNCAKTLIRIKTLY